MLHLDAGDLYDLSEAGRLLFADPERLRRWIRQHRIPGTEVDGELALPAAWVDAAAGRSPSDAETLKRYWLDRLAPAAPEARRPRKDTDALGDARLLTEDEAGRALFADPVRLRRLGTEGVLPSLLVDGRPRYDARLVQDMAEASEGRETPAAVAQRRDIVRHLSRYEYVSDLETDAPVRAVPTPPAKEEAVAAAPRAWSIPSDIRALASEPIAEEGETDGDESGSRLIRTEGFETADEDP
ncbi:MAG: hypothetical protein ACYTG6_09590 [Planctomycetota bacterium]|jgi:hypothetical protein